MGLLVLKTFYHRMNNWSQDYRVKIPLALFWETFKPQCFRTKQGKVEPRPLTKQNDLKIWLLCNLGRNKESTGKIIGKYDYYMEKVRLFYELFLEHERTKSLAGTGKEFAVFITRERSKNQVSFGETTFKKWTKCLIREKESK